MEYQLFISHADVHHRIYGSLVNRLNDAKLNGRRFHWKDRSISFQRRSNLGHEDLRAHIQSEIQASDALVVLARPIATRREWLKWEVEVAKQFSKPVVGFGRRGERHTSKFVRENADALVLTGRVSTLISAIATQVAEAKSRPRREALDLVIPAAPRVTPIEEITEPDVDFAVDREVLSSGSAVDQDDSSPDDFIEGANDIDPILPEAQIVYLPRQNERVVLFGRTPDGPDAPIGMRNSARDAD